jgi:predicted DNA-binding protein
MGKQPNPMIGTRVSPEWKVRIETIAAKTGRNPSQVVYEAIAAYLNEDDAATIGSTIENILSRLETLEEQQAAIKVLLAR